MRRLLALFCLLAVCVPSARTASAQSTSLPELPRTYLDSTYTVGTRAPIPVPAGADLQAALDEAVPGDTLLLEAGATFTGTFVLPAKPGGEVITIRTSTPDASFVAPGTRVGPANAPLMPKIVSPHTGPPLSTAPGAHHYRLLGIEITVPAADNFLNYGLLVLGDASAQSSLSSVPHDIVVDRCYIHGRATANVRRGIALNSAATSIVDSYVSEVHEAGVDTQAICAWNGPGPYKIVNNYLEASGENVMFGGADPAISGLVPSDVEFRRNHLSKPLSWKPDHPSFAGRHWTVKNIFELKNAQRVLVDGNVFEQNWASSQNGFAILFTVRNQDGTAPWSVVQDVTFTNNVVRHVSSGVNILGWDDIRPSQQTKRIRIANNLFEDVTETTWGGMGRLLQLLNGPADVTFDHNTCFQSNNVVTADTAPSPGFVFTNNIALHNEYGVIGTGTGPGTATLGAYLPSALFAANALVGGPEAIYPAGNFFPATVGEVGFVDPSGDYHLLSSSPYRNAGTDGRDLGADMDAVAAAAGAPAPAPDPEPEPDPEPSDTTPPVFANITASSVTASSATITWDTDEASDTTVEYGSTASYGSAATSAEPPQRWHTVTLTGLSSGTQYYYRALSRDAAGNLAASAGFTFTTSGSSTPQPPSDPEPTPPSDPTPGPEGVVWTSLVNCSSDGGTVWKSSGRTNRADAGAISEQSITSGDGYLELTVSETNTDRSVGLSRGDKGTDARDIDYAIRFGASGIALIRELGHATVATVPYASGDLFRIAVEGGVVRYYRNGALIHQSEKAPSYPLLVDSSFVDIGGSIQGAVLFAATPGALVSRNGLRWRVETVAQ